MQIKHFGEIDTFTKTSKVFLKQTTNERTFVQLVQTGAFLKNAVLLLTK